MLAASAACSGDQFVDPGSAPVIKLAEGQATTIRSGTPVRLNITDPLGVGRAAYVIRGITYDMPRPYQIDTSSFPNGTVEVAVEAENVYGVKARGLVGAMLIKGTKEKDTAYDQAAVSVPTTAKVYRWVKGKKLDAKFGDIKKGDRVQATFTGPVLESFPVQAKASEVIILEAPKEEK